MKGNRRLIDASSAIAEFLFADETRQKLRLTYIVLIRDSVENGMYQLAWLERERERKGKKGIIKVMYYCTRVSADGEGIGCRLPTA